MFSRLSMKAYTQSVLAMVTVIEMRIVLRKCRMKLLECKFRQQILLYLYHILVRYKKKGAELESQFGPWMLPKKKKKTVRWRGGDLQGPPASLPTTGKVRLSPATQERLPLDLAWIVITALLNPQCRKRNRSKNRGEREICNNHQ